MVDLDVPRNGTRVQLLHWMAANVTLGSSNSSGATPLNIPVGVVPYLQPSPPVGDVPHAYTFIVFPQPANFSVPAQYADLAQNRVGFNTSQFLKDAGLGQAIAANYIRVQNLTGTAAFPGGAQSSTVGGVSFWVGLSTALLAGVAAIAL
jgi:phosphatidylethanolamine-binding protein (PEBP) family uncharacterized protein